MDINFAGLGLKYESFCFRVLVRILNVKLLTPNSCMKELP